MLFWKQVCNIILPSLYKKWVENRKKLKYAFIRSFYNQDKDGHFQASLKQRICWNQKQVGLAGRPQLFAKWKNTIREDIKSVREMSKKEGVRKEKMERYWKPA